MRIGHFNLFHITLTSKLGTTELDKCNVNSLLNSSKPEMITPLSNKLKIWWKCDYNFIKIYC